MKKLVIRKNGENISYSGSQFDEIENIGSRALYINNRRYPLTSKPLNDKYSKMKMRINNWGGGSENIGYIAQRYSTSSSKNISKTSTITHNSSSRLSTKNTTRVSNYVSSQTLVTNSSSRLSTYNTTRTTNIKTYYGNKFVNRNYTTRLFTSWAKYEEGFFRETRTKVSSPVINAASAANLLRMTYTENVHGLIMINPNGGNIKTNSASRFMQNESITVSYGNYYSTTRVLSTKNYIASSTLRTNYSSRLSTKNTTRVSNYVSSQTLVTNSYLETKTYLTTTSNSMITNNINL